jgi:hypothetical protein
MNALFQEYKRQVDECRIILSEDVNLPFAIHATTFSTNDLKKDKKHNRAKEKRKTEKLIDESREDR